MILVGFEYYWLIDVVLVVQLLIEYGDEVCVIVGGYSFILMMKLCMVEMGYFVDFQFIEDMKGVIVSGGIVNIGVMVIQYELIINDDLGFVLLILCEVVFQIVDLQVWYCGIVGGNVVNGDLGNDMLGLM